MHKSDRYWAGCALIGGALFLYLQLFILPNVPVLNPGDHNIWIVNGRRMLEGQVIYRDFFEYVFPGTDTAFCALFYLFGVHAWVVSAALLFLGVGFAWTSFVISGKLFSGAAAILPGFLFLAVPFRNAPAYVGTHHWYSTLAVMGALAVLIEVRSTRRLLIAGAICGISAWFNQTRGTAGLLGFSVFLLWERLRTKESWGSLVAQEARLIGSFATTLVGLTSYYVWRAGLQRFLYCTVVFLIRYLPSHPAARWNVYGTDMPPFANWYKTTPLWTWLAIELLVPCIYFLFFSRAGRERIRKPEEPWDRLMLVSIVGLCLFLSVAPSALNYRLCTVSPPALILLVWFAKWPGKIERVVLPLLWIGLLALAIMETRNIQTRWHGTLQLPVGRVATFNRFDPEALQWEVSHLKPPDLLFGSPFLNFALGLPNPTPMGYLTNSDFTRPEQVQSVVETLEAKRVRWVECCPGADVPEGTSDHTGLYRDYIRKHYHVVKIFYANDLQILENNGK